MVGRAVLYCGSRSVMVMLCRAVVVVGRAMVVLRCAVVVGRGMCSRQAARSTAVYSARPCKRPYVVYGNRNIKKRSK